MTPPKYIQCAFVLLGTLLFLQTQRAFSASQLSQSERLFQVQCAGCHGPKGEGGSGPTLATPALVRATTEALLMPSYRDVFSKEELDDVVAYLVSLRGAK